MNMLAERHSHFSQIYTCKNYQEKLPVKMVVRQYISTNFLKSGILGTCTMYNIQSNMFV